MGNINFISTGGTLTMDSNPNGYKTTYDIRHLLAAVKIKDSQLSEKDEKALYSKLTKLKTSEYDTHQIDEEINSLLEPLGTRTIYHLMLEYGVSPNILTPYKPLSYSPSSHVSKTGLLDSINFDFPTHFPALKESLLSSLPDKNSSAIVFGGTDTMEYYSSALNAELNKTGKLLNNNVIFVSSMYTFEDNPSHIAGLLKGALKAAETVSTQHSEDIPTLHGAYLLSPELDAKNDVKAVKLHDISKGIVKISSRLKDAFRSNNGIADTIEFLDEKVVHHPSDNTPTQFNQKASTETGQKRNVAPPLIKGNSPQILLAYLNKILTMEKEGDKPFDILPIENFQSFAKSSYALDILKTIKQLAKKEIRVAFFQDVMPKTQTSSKFDVVNSQLISKESTYVKELVKAGCLFETGPTIKLYTDLRSNALELPIINFTDDVNSAELNLDKTPPSDKPIKIKYVPDQLLFKPMLELASEISNHIVIEGLPGQALPDYYQDTVQEVLQKGTKLSLGFKYNGRKFTEGNETFTEGNDGSHTYAASKWVEKTDIKICGETPPAEIGLE